MLSFTLLKKSESGQSNARYLPLSREENKRFDGKPSIRGARPLSTAQGSAILNVLIALGLVATVVATSWPIISQQIKGANRINASLSATLVRSNVLQNLRNAAAWQATLDAAANCNPTLSCIRNKVTCPENASQAPQQIQCLYNAGGRLIFDGRDPKSGFDDAGKPCDPPDFNANSGNAACPFRPTITWICDASPCDGTTPIKVNVEFQYSGHSDINLNMNRFSIVDEYH